MKAAEDIVKWDNRLKVIRLNKGFNQVDIAESVGLSQNTILQIEKGKLSGRKHMDSIARVLNVDPVDVFPYYDLLTFVEAATEMGVSHTLIATRVEEGVLPSTSIGSSKLVSRADLKRVRVRKRPGPSIKEALRLFLMENDRSGATVAELTGIFGPFSSDVERDKKMNSVRTILSRHPEFTSDKSKSPPIWKTSHE